MATGKCVNIGKPCSKALKKYVIEADKTNFVCPECGGKLIACDGPVTDPDSLKKPVELLRLIIAIKIIPKRRTNLCIMLSVQ